MKGIRLRHLVFTGPSIDPAAIEFLDGLNIVYGASNTGKSFALEALLFMLGAVSKLPKIDEIKAYNAIWLGLTLDDHGDFTLYRPTKGGQLKLFPGLISSHPTGKGETLSGKHSAKSTNSVSQRILETLGLQDRWIVRNASGAKDSLAFRLLAKFAVVGEDDIMSKRSPVYVSNSVTDRTLDQNVFKLLLTGEDDAATETTPNEPERVAAKAAKLELVDEMLAQLDQELGDSSTDRVQVEGQLAALEAGGGKTTTDLQAVQGRLDEYSAKRRTSIEQRQELATRAAELDITLERFAKLQSVYRSDLDRLHSIEEGGNLLSVMVVRDCPVCGAPPGAQTHQHPAEEILRAHTAAAAEARKIEREQRELAQVIGSLRSEAFELSTAIATLDDQIKESEQHALELRPIEASLRNSFESYSAERADLGKLIDLLFRREKLMHRRGEIDAASTKSERAPLPVGPDDKVVTVFGETVKAVLVEWGFPGADTVQFDAKTNDITVAGKPRDANGKGVRAVLHAAFNVAVALHCIDKELPHPGFLVLDTPLLTYREPIKSRHGDLAEDEKALKATSLAEKFYRHLASLEEKLQVIVIENSDPPPAIEELAHIEVFTGLASDGRCGLLANHSA